MALLMPVIAGLIVVMALFSSGVVNRARYDNAAIVDSLAPESVIYGGGANAATAANMTAAANTAMEQYRLTSVEQTLVNICRVTYYLGKANNCSALNESFTWSYMFQAGNTGSLNAVQGLTSSSTFTCAHPEQYGVNLLNNVYSITDLAPYTYNLMKSDNSAPISGQADPCAYADIVN